MKHLYSKQNKLFFIFILIIYLQCPATAYENCPQDFIDNPTLILVSLDGFRSEYLQRGITPRIEALRKSGTSAKFMKSVSPTQTFPNHYSIVTGLYPESHGIIANHFYDPNLDANFDKSDEASHDSAWWGGQPIWNTAIYQNKKSATFFWPGSDSNINETHPTYYREYDASVPFQERIDTILYWLTLPAEQRPVYLSVYFDEPDHTAHRMGPNSKEVNNALKLVDNTIGKLVDGIENLNLTNCVNLIVISDHGMTESGVSKIIELSDYVSNIQEVGTFFDGAFPRIRVKNQDEKIKENIQKNLTCKTPNMLQFLPSKLPMRFHFSNNDRIEDIVLLLNKGNIVNLNSKFAKKGKHGYDPHFRDMNAIFIAVGPEFLEETEVEEFRNIELYNLLCLILRLNPAPNNGTLGSLYHLLKTPPPYPDVDPIVIPPSPPFPNIFELILRKFSSGCKGDGTTPVNLKLSDSEKEKLLNKHVPFGPPQNSLIKDIILLYQHDYVTAYSEMLRMPLWIGFTVTNVPENTGRNRKWSSDIRLKPETSPTCKEYDEMKEIDMHTLFPKLYENNTNRTSLVHLVSNLVPMTKSSKKRWEYLTDVLLQSWIKTYSGPINVILGPVFDKNSDSLADDLSSFKTFPTVPSHYFLVATRCVSTSASSLETCPQESLDAISFMLPQNITIENCITPSKFALLHTVRIRDIELATGFQFNALLSAKHRLRLSLLIHSKLWPSM